MNRDEFMSKLEVYLKKAYGSKNQNEIDDVLRDYSELFSDAMSEGKSEYEVAESFGEPKDIVEEMLRNDGIYDKNLDSDLYDLKDRVFSGAENLYSKAENMYTNADKKKIGGLISNISSVILKLIFAGAIILADIVYFSIIAGAVIALVICVGMGALSIPYIFSSLSVIGQNIMMILFPVLIILGSLLLFLPIAFVAIKFGINLNKKLLGILTNR